MGSWVKLDTPAQKFRVLLLHSTPYHHPEVAFAFGLPGVKILIIFLFVRTDLSYCISLKAVVKVSYETMWTTCLYIYIYIYILHIKYIKIISLF